MRTAARRPTAAGGVLCAALMLSCSSPPAPDPQTGFRGGVLLGMRAVVGDVEADDTGTVRVSVPPPSDVSLDVVVDVQEPDCADPDDPRPCPHAEDARLDFVVSALLDLRTAVPVDRRGSATIVHRGAERRTYKFDLALPQLAAGRHCLVLAVVENPAVLVPEQLADHSSATAYNVHVGTGTPNHCRSEPPADVARASADVAGDPCGVAVLGPSPDGLEIRRTATAGAALYASVPACGVRSSGVYLRDGVLQSRGAFGPFTLAQDSPSEPPLLHVVPVPLVDDGFTHFMTVLDSGHQTLVTLSNPVVID